ncbi:MAG TPA: VWA domain-containing protein [Rhizobiales bacterium]|nr:VWA domain-containing protein [Hyphomicrobiales bacterium]
MNDKKSPVVTGTGKEPAPMRSDPREVAAFLRAARSLGQDRAGRGRLILALDATMSRQPTWDLACRVQADMFDAVADTGRLAVQLVYFRGHNECRASRFVSDTGALKELMLRIDCRGGQTQIGKVLAHALKETARDKVAALVYIGDALEEAIDDLADKAGQLGLRGVPVFVFQEGADPVAERGFREIARLSRGAWFRFDHAAASTLAKLLASVAVFAAGGTKALAARGRPEDLLMLEHLGGRGK